MSKILLAEDDKFLRTIYHQKLSEKKNWTVLLAQDGEEAMQMIMAEKPDLVIIDLMMPKKDGFQVLSEMKQNEALKNIPVIVSSALGQESDVKKGLDMGAVDYLTKTESTVGLIIEKVEEHLGKAPVAVAPVAPPAPVEPPIAVAPPTTQPGGKFCPNCGKPTPQEAKFCPSCGTQII